MLDLGAISEGVVALVGIPSDENSSALAGPAAAPGVIRSALFDPGANLCTEHGESLSQHPRLVDPGDVRLPDADREQWFAAIVDQIGGVLRRDATVLSLGGDHAVSYPLVAAHAEHRGSFSIVQIDAHPDLYDTFQDNPWSHACPFARIMENGLAKHLVQIGIRASSPHQQEQAARFGVQTVDLRAEPDVPGCLPEGPVYLSLDLDGLDPAYVPGVSHPEPGGLSTRDVIRIIQQLPGPLIGADLVELNPRRDIGGLTAGVAAKLAKELLGRLLRDSAK